MEDREKKKIRIIYSELQGYLKQAPNNEIFWTIQSVDVWQHVNETIDELDRISAEDYSRYKIIPKRGGQFNQEYVETDTYRTKLGGLIMRLHGQYFSDEPSPFSGMPSTVNIQTQQQSQSVYIQILIKEVRDKIEHNLPKFDEGTEEKTFLQKLKESLSSIKDVSGLIMLTLKIAQECGLSIDSLMSILKTIF